MFSLINAMLFRHCFGSIKQNQTDLPPTDGSIHNTVQRNPNCLTLFDPKNGLTACLWKKTYGEGGEFSVTWIDPLTGEKHVTWVKHTWWSGMNTCDRNAIAATGAYGPAKPTIPHRFDLQSLGEYIQHGPSARIKRCCSISA
jgi:hypothetical protein